MYKLLIVDDNISDRKGLAELVNWEAMGITEIVLAKNGMDGYKKAVEFCPSLILTDISMPIMDGLEMAKKILEELPKTKFIFMSCYDDVEYIRSAMDYNAYGYLLKPINLDKLTETVKKILKIKKSEHEMNETMLNLKRQVEEHMPYVRELVTQDIVYGNLSSSYVSQLESLSMSIKTMYSVVVIHINDSVGNDMGVNCMALYDMKKYMMENILGQMRVCSFLQSRTSLVAMVYLDDAENEQKGIERLFDYLNVSKDYINNKLGYECLMCAGGISDEIEKAPELYNSAEYTLKTNIYGMGNNIILAEKSENADSMLDYDIVNLKAEITDMFSNNNFGIMQSFLNKYYDKNTYNKNSLKAFTYTLISILQLVLLDRNESFTNVFGDDTMVWNKLSEYNTILDIRQWVVNIFKFAYDYLNEKNENGGKYIMLVNSIKKIINEEYGSIENVNQISDRTYTSQSYANHIFKQYEGVTIFEYLVRVRMEKAKDMLKNTDMKIYEISEKVGYMSKTYFASLFREYTGKSPKLYRTEKQK